MTIEEFDKAQKIRQDICLIEKDNIMLKSRIERFNDYLKFLDGRVNPITFNNKKYPKAEIKFNINQKPTDIDVRDVFNIVDENKKEFVDFLKKCQINYSKKLKENEKLISNLEQEFLNIGGVNAA